MTESSALSEKEFEVAKKNIQKFVLNKVFASGSDTGLVEIIKAFRYHKIDITADDVIGFMDIYESKKSFCSQGLLTQFICAKIFGFETPMPGVVFPYKPKVS